jgi:hypothetical protein
VTAFLWFVATLPSGDPFALVIVMPWVAIGQICVLVAGLWFRMRAQPRRSLAYAHVAGLAPLFGIGVGCGILGLVFLVLS